MPPVPDSEWRVVVSPLRADNLSNLQAASDSLVDGGDVILMPGVYQLSNTWVISSLGETSRPVNVRAATAGTVEISAISDASFLGNRSLLLVKNNVGYKLEGLYLYHPGRGALFGSIGLALGEDSSLGPRASRGIIERVEVQGFGTAFQVETTNDTFASDVTFLDCTALECDTGMQLYNASTCNVILTSCTTKACQVGVSISAATDVHVLAGSGLNNGTEFNIVSSGTFSISKFRSREAAQFLRCTDTAARASVNVESCEASNRPRVDINPLILGGWGAFLTLTSCSFDGFIAWDQQRNADGDPLRQGTLTMIKTCIRDRSSTAPPNPFRVRNFDNDAENLLYRVLGCSWRNESAAAGAAPDGWIPDQIGVVTNGELVPAWKIDHLGRLSLRSLDSVGTLTGSWSDGSAVRNLAALLAQVGLITDQTSA